MMKPIAVEKLKDGDGITHINVYSEGKTKIGRDLSNFTFSPFNHPRHGVFNSVEGYWYWLSRQDERLRQSYGIEAKRLGRSLNKVKHYTQEEFRIFVKEALSAKLEQHKNIANLFFASKLPLTHYYVMGPQQKILFPKDCEWIIEHFENLRSLANPGIVYDTLSLPVAEVFESSPQIGLF